jgi:hypothetical protein
MAQQANPNPKGQREDFLAQLTALSKLEKRIVLPKQFSIPI